MSNIKTPLIQRLENRKNRSLAAILECDRKIRDLELQRERHRGEVSSLDDAIDDAKQEGANPPNEGAELTGGQHVKSTEDL